MNWMAHHVIYAAIALTSSAPGIDASVPPPVPGAQDRVPAVTTGATLRGVESGDGKLCSLSITIQAMTSRLGQWLRDPLLLLCVTAGLLAFVVQSGELGTADTAHRLQTTHWLWTSEPQVFPYEYPEFGLHGRGGRLYSWYGIGQSLLMLPADLVGTWIANWSVFSDYSDDPAVRSIVVSYTTSILVDILTALIAFRLLNQFGFRIKESVAGVLALLFCTSHLHYTQNMMENNYVLLHGPGEFSRNAPSFTKKEGK